LKVVKVGAETYLALQNADELLREVVKAVDTNGDGKIQYEGMRLQLNVVCGYSRLNVG